MGSGLLARPVERVARVVAGDADLPLGLLVVRLEIVVGDRPVVERAARRPRRSGDHAEVLRMKRHAMAP